MEAMNRAQAVNFIAHHARPLPGGVDDHVFIPSDRLAELGDHSVDRAEIVMFAQESLGLRVPRVELFGRPDIGELADLLVSNMAAW